MNNITALIMAAGTDDKMKSKKSKLAQTIYGKEVIKRVVNSVKKAGIEEVGVIVGENKEEIESISMFRNRSCNNASNTIFRRKIG